MHRKIEIGQTYGRLKVMEYLEVRWFHKHNFKFYKCECACGNTLEVPSTYIGKCVKSCGCLQKESREKMIEPGTVFGRLKVIGISHLVKGRGYHYNCECSCGNIISVYGSHLRSGETQSCGCLHDELLSQNAKTAYKNNFVMDTSLPKIKADNPQRNNTSGYAGVSWHKGRGKWVVRISFQKKVYYLGYYDDIADAVAVRKIAKKNIHGDFLEWYGNRDSKSDLPHEKK